MIKINQLSTLFVGIDVSSRSNVVYAMDFEKNKAFSSSFGNNQPGAEFLEKTISEYMLAHKNLNTIVIALEATSVLQQLRCHGICCPHGVLFFAGHHRCS